MSNANSTAPIISIITTCKGRLHHLKESLPKMLAQKGAEVIVVDYDCPDGTSSIVHEQFPSARLVTVNGRPFFNNWEARNLGAAEAHGSLLAFVDADTLLAPDFASWAIANVEPDHYAKMNNALELSKHKDLALGNRSNRLEGLLVVPAGAFRMLQGYDALLQGWGAGGDTDFVDRLDFHKITRLVVPEDLVVAAIAHSDAERTKFHRLSVSESHLTGLLYRTAKLSMMKLFSRELAPEDRARLYALASEAANRRSANGAGLDLLVLSNEVFGSNYKIEQHLVTRITWTDRSLNS